MLGYPVRNVFSGTFGKATNHLHGSLEDKDTLETNQPSLPRRHFGGQAARIGTSHNEFPLIVESQNISQLYPIEGIVLFHTWDPISHIVFPYCQFSD